MSYVLYVAGLLALLGALAAIRPLPRLRLRTRSAGRNLILLGVLGILLALLWPQRLLNSGSSHMLIDTLMPTYHFNEVHTLTIKAPPERVYQAILQVTPQEIALLRPLFWLRSLGGCGSLGGERQARAAVLDEMRAQGFMQLDEAPGRELLLGTVGQFWSLSASPQTLGSTPEFFAFSQPGFVKAAMNFFVTDAGDGASRVVTETRILATDAAARRRFGLYWRVIYPGSALIRIMWLRAVKRRAEQAP